MSNDQMPRTFGDSVIHQSHIDVMVECNGHKLHERPPSGPAAPEEKKIGELIANNLVEDGATLQMGMKVYFLRVAVASESFYRFYDVAGKL